MLAPWVAAGVDVFKVQGRELPAARLFDLVSRVRGKLDAAIAVAGRGHSSPASRR
jgi:collagenase-like PrtC family protease